MSALRVAIVADWAKRCRGLFWPEVLDELGDNGVLATDYKVIRLAERNLRNGGPDEGAVLIKEMQDRDVLIVNWDAVNGDPEYGADYALSWFGYHGPQVLLWVKAGGILILEGQATLGAPTQAAYDALLGATELAVSGPEDPADPQKQRVGDACVVTKAARSSPLFAGLNDLRATADRNYKDMFPDGALDAMDPSFLVGSDWRILYRGWFRRRPRRGHRLPWVVLVRAKQRLAFPTLFGARLGDGAVFASTMLLASSGQEKLIAAMLRSHGRTGELPAPRNIGQTLRSHLTRTLLPVGAGVVAATVVHETFLKEVTRAGLILGGLVLGAALPRLWTGARRLWRRFRGD